MSEDQQLMLPPEGSDFTMKDLEFIQKFKDNGLLGLASVSHLDHERMLGLYMDGKTYRQIAAILHIKKDTILYLSYTQRWYEMRKDYLEEVGATMPNKILESKLQSQEFLLNLVTAYQKKIGKNVNDYFRTNDKEKMNSLDTKDVATYLKIYEMLHKVSAENAANPLVGLNGMGDGVTITKTGKNSVEITPKGGTPIGSRLKQFAELKRQQEKEQQEASRPSRDIVIEQSKTEKESEDENE